MPRVQGLYGSYDLATTGAGAPGAEPPVLPTWRTETIDGYKLPAGYAMVPVGQMEEWQSDRKKLWAVFGVILMLAVLATWWTARSRDKKPAEVLSNMSRQRLAQSLHDKLERAGESDSSVLMKALRKEAGW